MKKTKYIYEKEIKNNRSIIINTISFDYIILEKDEYNLWLNQKWNKLEKNVIQTLLKKRLLIYNENQDVELQKYAFETFKNKKNISSPIFVIYITNKCNLRCSYCFTGYEIEKKYEKMSEKEIDKIINVIEKICKSKNVKKPVISIFGGEPLLISSYSLVEYLLKKLEQIDYLVCEIVSNIMHIDKYLPLLTSYKKRLDIKVTFNGNMEVHDSIRKSSNGNGTYLTTMENIILILKNTKKIYINISILLEKIGANLTCISGLMKELKNAGVYDDERVKISFGLLQFRSSYLGNNFKNRILEPELYYPMLFDVYDNEKLITEEMITGSSMYRLMDIYKYWKYGDIYCPDFSGCNAINPGIYCFYPDGYIYPCFDCVGLQYFRIGEYKEKFSLYKIYEKINSIDITQNKKCNSCNFFTFCNGGCIITNHTFNKEMTKVKCEPVEKGLSNFITMLDKRGFFDESSIL